MILEWDHITAGKEQDEKFTPQKSRLLKSVVFYLWLFFSDFSGALEESVTRSIV